MISETTTAVTLRVLREEWEAPLRAENARLQAEVAAMRQALQYDFPHGNGHGCECCDAAYGVTEAALSGTAGQALLDELGRLRAVAQAARAIAGVVWLRHNPLPGSLQGSWGCVFCGGRTGTDPFVASHEEDCSWLRLNKALR